MKSSSGGGPMYWSPMTTGAASSLVSGKNMPIREHLNTICDVEELRSGRRDIEKMYLDNR